MSFYPIDFIFIRWTGDKSGAEAPGPSGFPISFKNLLTFLFQNLSSDLEYFYLEAAGLQKDRRGL